MKRNLRTHISQKVADLRLWIEPKNCWFKKKTVAWQPLQIYSGAWGKLIHEKKPDVTKSCGTIPLNFFLHVQNCTKWKLQIHAVIPCQLETIGRFIKDEYCSWVLYKSGPGGGAVDVKKSTLNDLVHLTPLRIPLMNPPYIPWLNLLKGPPPHTHKWRK
jgi:hypothetical protein